MVDGRISSPQWGTEGSPLSGGGGVLNPVPCGWWLAHGRKGFLTYVTHLLRQRLLVTMFPHSILSLIRCTSHPAVPLKACATRRGSVWLCTSCPLHHSLAAGAGRSDRQPVICRPHSGPRHGLSPQKKDTFPWLTAGLTAAPGPLHLLFLSASDAFCPDIVPSFSFLINITISQKTLPPIRSKMTAPVTLCPLALLYFLHIFLADTV